VGLEGDGRAVDVVLSDWHRICRAIVLWTNRVPCICVNWRLSLLELL
jgi:hypothetical protein